LFNLISSLELFDAAVQFAASNPRTAREEEGAATVAVAAASLC